MCARILSNRYGTNTESSDARCFSPVPNCGVHQLILLPSNSKGLGANQQSASRSVWSRVWDVHRSKTLSRSQENILLEFLPTA